MDIATWGLVAGVAIFGTGVAVALGAELKPFSRRRRRRPPS